MNPCLAQGCDGFVSESPSDTRSNADPLRCHTVLIISDESQVGRWGFKSLGYLHTSHTDASGLVAPSFLPTAPASITLADLHRGCLRWCRTCRCRVAILRREQFRQGCTERSGQGLQPRARRSACLLRHDQTHERYVLSHSRYSSNAWLRRRLGDLSPQRGLSTGTTATAPQPTPGSTPAGTAPSSCRQITPYGSKWPGRIVNSRNGAGHRDARPVFSGAPRLRQ
jgi:hypothetical protein